MWDWTNPDINDRSDPEASFQALPIKKKTTSCQASKQPSILADDGIPTKLTQIPSKVARRIAAIAAESCQNQTPGDDGKFEETCESADGSMEDMFQWDIFFKKEKREKKHVVKKQRQIGTYA